MFQPSDNPGHPKEWLEYGDVTQWIECHDEFMSVFGGCILATYGSYEEIPSCFTEDAVKLLEAN